MSQETGPSGQEMAGAIEQGQRETDGVVAAGKRVSAAYISGYEQRDSRENLLFEVFSRIPNVSTEFSQDLTGIVAKFALNTRQITQPAISSRWRARAPLLREVVSQDESYAAFHGMIRHPKCFSLGFQVLSRE